MKLYVLHRCPFGHRASFALREKGVAFEPVFFERGKRPPELAALGPHAKSPTLVDGDVVVWDSPIVLEYVDERFPEPPLLPRSAEGRALARMLGARVRAELVPKFDVVETEMEHRPKPDEAAVATATRAFLDALVDWDGRLGRAFLLGDALSVADITLFALFPAMERLAGIVVPPELARLRAWHARMAARPGAALLEPRVA